MGEARIEEDVEGKKCKERKADITLFHDRKTPTTYIHALENKIPKPNRKQLDTGKLVKGPSSFSSERSRRAVDSMLPCRSDPYLYYSSGSGRSPEAQRCWPCHPDQRGRRTAPD